MLLIVGKLPIKAKWQDASITLRDFSRSNKRNFMPASVLDTKFYCNNRVANSSLWKTEHWSPYWEAEVITIKLFHTGLGTLIFVYIQLKVLEWSWIDLICLKLRKTRFIQTLQPLPQVAYTPNRTTIISLN